jgi:predicted MFS family arabinose efflux permease
MAESRLAIVGLLGVGQILAWGSSFYLPAVLAKPIADNTGWPLPWVIGALSIGLLLSGLISPMAGDIIQRRGGRPVLVASAALLAGGLFVMAASPNVIVFICAWLLIGAGMGAGLYDPAFAALGRLYGKDARTPITSLTLIAGFASTVCWPLSAFLLDRFGWRGTCVAYAMLDLCLVLPLYRFGLPYEAPDTAMPRKRMFSRRRSTAPPQRVLVFVLLALSLTLISVIASVMSVHLLTILQLRDVSLDVAVALGATVGPCQVGARLIDLFIAHRFHPIWELLLSAVTVVIGIGLLLSGITLPLVGLLLYGAGIGLRSIVRGTLPLALFGAEGYASLLGRLALPTLIAQAAAPSLGAVVLDNFGANGLLGLLFWLALATLVSSVLLVPLVWRPQTATSG